MKEDAINFYNSIKNDRIIVEDMSHPQFEFRDYVKYIVGDSFSDIVVDVMMKLLDFF